MVIKINENEVACSSVTTTYIPNRSELSVSVQINGEDFSKDDQYYVGLIREAKTITLPRGSKEMKYSVTNKNESSFTVNYSDDNVSATLSFAAKISE